MLARYIFPVLALVFLALATRRYVATRKLAGAARTWMVVGSAFALVSGFLWLS